MQKLQFNANGKFTIMQVSDVQDIGGLLPRTQELYLSALDRVNPDFVVFTGDQLKGYGLKAQVATQDQRERRMMQTLTALAAPLELRGIPFTITFGNHDHDVPMHPLTQFERWQLWSNCMVKHSDGVPGFANHVLEVADSQGDFPAMLLYFLDSHGPNGFGYTPLDPGQIAWYKDMRDTYAAQNNGKVISSMLFQHVPVEEMYRLFKPVEKKTPGALEGFRNYKGKYFVLDEDKVAPGSFMGELPSSPDENAGLFEAAMEKGDMLGMFFGHDHNNGFHGKVDGIALGYAPAAGYTAYGPGRKRGVRVFHFDENDLTNFESYVLTDEQLLHQPLSARVKLQDAGPSSWGEAAQMLRRNLPKVGIGAAGVALSVAAVKLLRKKK